MTRRGVAAAIFAAWAVSLGWLVKREYFQPTSARLAEAALSVPPGATFYRLDLGDRQVGFASSTVDTLPDSIRVEEVLVLEVPALGRLYRTSARSTAVLTRTLRLRRLEATFDGDGGRFAARGTVTGDSALRLVLLTGADSHVVHLRRDRPVVLPALLPLRLAFGTDLAPGSRHAIRLFDPLLLAEREVTATVAAESVFVVADSAAFDVTAGAWVAALFDTVRAFRIDLEAQGGGTRTSAWIDAQGKIVRLVTPTGFTMERSAFEIAYENFRRRDTAAVARGSARPALGVVVPTTALVAGIRLRSTTPTEQLRLRLGGVARGRVDLAGGRQSMSGDTLVVRREARRELTARYRLGAPPDTLAAWLAAEPLIQSDDPRVQARARLILGRERDPVRAAERLASWVHDALPARPAAGVPSAVRVLERPEDGGDCNEHTVLYVALARAAGIPARPVAGLVALEGRFYYHAWAEVYLGDWVAVDPLLGQFPADAGHVRVVVGGLARHVELLRFVGGLTVEVL